MDENKKFEAVVAESEETDIHENGVADAHTESLPDDEAGVPGIDEEAYLENAEEGREDDASANVDDTTPAAYAEMQSDLEKLKISFPELRGVKDISFISGASRYGELRALGLTAEEAYLATRGRRTADSRAHLTDSFPREARAPASSMSRQELLAARELFSGLDDSQIIKLYRKVTR